MSMQRSRPGHTVRVDSQMVGDAEVVIEAALEYWAHLSEAERERLTESLHRFLDGRTKVPVKLLVAPPRTLPRPAGTGMATRQLQEV